MTDLKSKAPITSSCKLSYELLKILGCNVEYKDAGYPEKLYYSITEVSKIIGVPAHVIRYWEKHFPILNPGRGSSSNWRNYVSSDIKALQEIKSLINDQCLTINGAKRAMAGGISRVNVVDKLESLLSELEDTTA